MMPSSPVQRVPSEMELFRPPTGFGSSTTSSVYEELHRITSGGVAGIPQALPCVEPPEYKNIPPVAPSPFRCVTENRVNQVGAVVPGVSLIPGSSHSHRHHQRTPSHHHYDEPAPTRSRQSSSSSTATVPPAPPVDVRSPPRPSHPPGRPRQQKKKSAASALRRREITEANAKVGMGNEWNEGHTEVGMGNGMRDMLRRDGLGWQLWVGLLEQRRMGVVERLLEQRRMGVVERLLEQRRMRVVERLLEQRRMGVVERVYGRGGGLFQPRAEGLAFEHSRSS
ncbi:unnamed protein product [Cyprideis torosa]|uniref:Uncharacterized protein n=1 Tax=Cyprideis torosa TaxID=163714 RepID=A0A7R8ZJK1_9CRUS|nr:unnamed protein product [Cyprideis torosa]CAG0887210.1 unnamed protein product [Cyprideis torosa]